MMQLYVVVNLLVAVSMVYAFPNGAPTGACELLAPSPRLQPDGHGAPPQRSALPYTVTCIRRNNQIEMSIQGRTPSQMFRGLLAQVRIGNRPVGTFRDIGKFKAACQGEGITHKSRKEKDSATFMVNVSPADLADANLECVVTVVQELAVYWVGHRQPAIDDASPGGGNNETTTRRRRGNGRGRGGRRGRRMRGDGRKGRRGRRRGTTTTVSK